MTGWATRFWVQNQGAQTHIPEAWTCNLKAQTQNYGAQTQNLEAQLELCLKGLFSRISAIRPPKYSKQGFEGRFFAYICGQPAKCSKPGF
jgi:hypothetical protein